jgi:hypothetical protein
MEQLIGKLPSISTGTKVSKIPKIECTHGGLPKTAKSHFGCFRTLGVKESCSLLLTHMHLFYLNPKNLSNQI